MVTFSITVSQGTYCTHKNFHEGIQFTTTPTKCPHISVPGKNCSVLLTNCHIHYLQVIFVEEVNHLGLNVRLTAIVMTQLTVLSLAECKNISALRVCGYPSLVMKAECEGPIHALTTLLSKPYNLLGAALPCSARPRDSTDLPQVNIDPALPPVENRYLETYHITTIKLTYKCNLTPTDQKQCRM
jgi:hypothetical protein